MHDFKHSAPDVWFEPVGQPIVRIFDKKFLTEVLKRYGFAKFPGNMWIRAVPLIPVVPISFM